ncbi:MAG: branched-chain amino acid ABC transporter permease [Deltaproteobacteria bacterium]|nr:branched-chain amino acid ABC transporter permease [Deltaproteobacteria bacterium]
MEGFLANLLNGLSWGMLLFLISIGLTTIFGVMGVLNFAHGSLFMLGAYLCMQFVRWVGSFWIGLLLGPPIVAVLSILLERFLLRPLYSRDVSFQLLLTFGVMLFLDDGVRLIWGAAYHVVNPPQILAGVIQLFSQSYPVYRLFLVILGPLVGIALWAFFSFTRWGKILRAAAMDRQMAEIVGVRVPMMYTAVFGFGAWLAALGGALAAPHQSVGPAMGERIIIESFIVVVIGGMGSFPGAFAGALILGMLNSFGTTFLPDVQMALPYILLAVILLTRPRGLFGGEA